MGVEVANSAGAGPCTLMGGRELVAHSQPQALANLVRGRLPRPSQVAVQLKFEGTIRHGAVVAEELVGIAWIPDPVAVWSLLAKVNANVEDDPRGS